MIKILSQNQKAKERRDISKLDSKVASKVKLHQKFFLLLVLLLPIQLGFHFWPESAFVLGIRVDYLSPTIYLSDIIVLVIFLLWFKEAKKNLKFSIKKSAKTIVYLAGFLIVNFIIATNKAAPLYKSLKLIECVFLGLYLKNYWTLKIQKKALSLLSLTVLYTSLIAIGQFWRNGSLGGFLRWLGERTFNIGNPGIALFDLNGYVYLRPYSIFSHPNALAGYIGLVLIIITFHKQATWFRFLTLFLGATSIILSYSQAVWIALLIVFLYSAAGLKKIGRSSRVLFLGIIALGLFTPLLITNLNLSENLSLRISLAKSAFSMWNQQPLFGVGLNNFIPLLPSYTFGVRNVWFLQPVHNIFLLTLAETGILGFIFLIIFFYKTVTRLVKYKNTPLLMALFFIAITGSFDHYWYTLQQTQLLAAITFGIAWSKPTIV